MNHRGVARVKARALVAFAAALSLAATATERSAPLVTMGSFPTERLSLGDPMVLDAIRDGVVTVRSLTFTAAGDEIPEGAVLAVEIEGPSGMRVNRSVPLAQAMGSAIAVPVGYEIPADRQGLLLTSVRVSRGDEVLFSGSYLFGYPRYETSRDLRRIADGALLRDDFEGPGPDDSIWTVRSHDPERARGEQRDGRYWITLTGRTTDNGLTSRHHPDSRDLVAVCRMGIRSPEGANHLAVLHVCGSGRLSPDHWFEVDLGDPDGRRATARSQLAAPARQKQGYGGGYTLPFPASDGYLVKIECRGEDNTCSGFARVEDEWWQIGDSFEVPARETKLEIKTNGFSEAGEGTSTAWFDDCRLYPRPQTHYMSVVLRTAGGRPPGTPVREGRSFCFGPDSRILEGCGYSIKLLDADGVTLIDETETSAAYGWGLLNLRSAPWDPYPASAIIRIESGGRQIGPDHVIRSDGVDGLYPDDVYAVTLE